MFNSLQVFGQWTEGSESSFTSTTHGLLKYKTVRLSGDQNFRRVPLFGGYFSTQAWEEGYSFQIFDLPIIKNSLRTKLNYGNGFALINFGNNHQENSGKLAFGVSNNSQGSFFKHGIIQGTYDLSNQQKRYLSLWGYDGVTFSEGTSVGGSVSMDAITGRIDRTSGGSRLVIGDWTVSPSTNDDDIFAITKLNDAYKTVVGFDLNKVATSGANANSLIQINADSISFNRENNRGGAVSMYRANVTDEVSTNKLTSMDIDAIDINSVNMDATNITGINVYATNQVQANRLIVDHDATVKKDLQVDGEIIAWGGSTPSDMRLKEKIMGIVSPLEKIKQIEGKTYKYKQDLPGKTMPETIQYGVIAQDLEKVFPSLVSEHQLGDDDTFYKTVNYTKLIPVLIEAVKELSQIIEEQQSEIDILKNRL